MKSRVISIVGTDTEVGKSIITASLAKAFVDLGLRVGAYKPFASDPATDANGAPYSTDAWLLAQAAGMVGGEAEARGQLFRTPLSPLAAARREGLSVNVRDAVGGVEAMRRRYDITLVEGCGGWLVPLTETETTAEFFIEVGAPVVIVGRAGLGTINHTLLTLNAIRAAGLDVLGVILNRVSDPDDALSERENPGLIEQFGNVQVWGPVEHVAELAEKKLEAISIDRLPVLAQIARELL